MKRTTKKILTLGMTAALATGALAGCGSSGSGNGTAAQSGSADGEKVLTFGCQNYGDGLVDPTNQTNAAWNCMCSGLTITWKWNPGWQNLMKYRMTI